MNFAILGLAGIVTLLSSDCTFAFKAHEAKLHRNTLNQRDGADTARSRVSRCRVELGRRSSNAQEAGTKVSEDGGDGAPLHLSARTSICAQHICIQGGVQYFQDGISLEKLLQQTPLGDAGGLTRKEGRGIPKPIDATQRDLAFKHATRNGTSFPPRTKVLRLLGCSLAEARGLGPHPTEYAPNLRHGCIGVSYRAADVLNRNRDHIRRLKSLYDNPRTLELHASWSRSNRCRALFVSSDLESKFPPRFIHVAPERLEGLEMSFTASRVLQIIQSVRTLTGAVD